VCFVASCERGIGVRGTGDELCELWVRTRVLRRSLEGEEQQVGVEICREPPVDLSLFGKLHQAAIVRTPIVVVDRVVAECLPLQEAQPARIARDPAEEPGVAWSRVPS
jgi:hypothetical protein